MTDPAPGPRLWGIAQSDLKAFLDVPLLEAAEAQTLFPFFIGMQLVVLLLVTLIPQLSLLPIRWFGP